MPIEYATTLEYNISSPVRSPSPSPTRRQSVSSVPSIQIPYEPLRILKTSGHVIDYDPLSNSCGRKSAPSSKYKRCNQLRSAYKNSKDPEEQVRLRYAFSQECIHPNCWDDAHCSFMQTLSPEQMETKQYCEQSTKNRNALGPLIDSTKILTIEKEDLPYVLERMNQNLDHMQLMSDSQLNGTEKKSIRKAYKSYIDAISPSITRVDSLIRDIQNKL